MPVPEIVNAAGTVVYLALLLAGSAVKSFY